MIVAIISMSLLVISSLETLKDKQQVQLGNQIAKRGLELRKFGVHVAYIVFILNCYSFKLENSKWFTVDRD